MKTLTQWTPFRELDELQNRLATLFGRSPLTVANGEKETIGLADWTPSVDITEDDKEYLIKADLPEVKKEDVKVSVENGVLSFSGERKQEREEKSKKYHRVERAYGSFTRSFALPDTTDSTKVSADFKEGVLKVHLPKSERALPKTVEVKVD